MANGKNDTFLASRKKGVHYFGEAIDETMTAEEAFRRGGLLGWDVRKVPLRLPNGVEMPDHFATVRTTPSGGMAPLGVVGGKYQTVQNEVLKDLCADVLDTGEVIAEAVGSTHGGRRVFASFRLPDSIEIDGEPGGVDTSLFFGTSHDGSMPLIAKVLHTRWVCTNQINGILGNKSAPQIKLRHTLAATKGRVQNVREALRIGFASRDAFQQAAEVFLQTPVTNAQFDEIVAGLFPIKEDAAQGAITRAENRREELREVYETSPTQHSIHGTAWGVVNSVVEWDDFIRAARSDEARALGQLGGRDDHKRHAVLTVARVLERPDLVM